MQWFSDPEGVIDLSQQYPTVVTHPAIRQPLWLDPCPPHPLLSPLYLIHSPFLLADSPLHLTDSQFPFPDSLPPLPDSASSASPTSSPVFSSFGFLASSSAACVVWNFFCTCHHKHLVTAHSSKTLKAYLFESEKNTFLQHFTTQNSERTTQQHSSKMLKVYLFESEKTLYCNT